jgi:hypothetical protein
VTEREKGLRELEDMEAMVEVEGARVFGVWLLGECAGANVSIFVEHRRHFKFGTSTELYLFLSLVCFWF